MAVFEAVGWIVIATVVTMGLMVIVVVMLALLMKVVTVMIAAWRGLVDEWRTFRDE